MVRSHQSVVWGSPHFLLTSLGTPFFRAEADSFLKIKGREDLEDRNIPLPLLQVPVEGDGMTGSSRAHTLRQSNAAALPPRGPVPLHAPTHSGPAGPGPRLLTHVQHTLSSGHLAPAFFRRKPASARPLAFATPPRHAPASRQVQAPPTLT
jgi:hypothetical protein